MASDRRFFVGGNWKMNGDSALVSTMAAVLNQTPLSSEVVIAPPFPLLSLAQKSFTQVGIAAQNCSAVEKGAYTGETSVALLKVFKFNSGMWHKTQDINIKWTILGHSERRELFSETNLVVAQKVAFALKNGLSVMACIGESLAQREQGKTMAVLFDQLTAIKSELTEGDWNDVVVAYEPGMF